MKKRWLFVLIILIVIGFFTPVMGEKNTPIEWKGEKSILKLSDYDNPIPIESIDYLQKQIITDYQTSEKLQKDKGNLSKVFRTEAYIPPGASIVAFGYFIDSNSVPHKFLGLAQNNESVDRVWKKANEWYNQEKMALNSNPSQIIRTTDGASWQEVLSDGIFYQYPPYGGVGNNYVFYIKLNDGNPNQDYFSVHQVFQQEPGLSIWGNMYASDNGWATHDWSTASGANPILWSWDPKRLINGPSDTITVSLNPAPSLSWSFSIPSGVQLEEYSSPSAKTAKWQIRMHDLERGHTQSFEPGSSCAVTPWPGQGEKLLLTVTSRGNFEDMWGYGYWGYCYWWWKIWVTCT
jgi:hypothetical protein